MPRPLDFASKHEFTYLGRPDSLPGGRRHSPKYRCRHCNKEFAAESPVRLRAHLAGCRIYQFSHEFNAIVRPRQVGQQSKLADNGIQHISKNEYATLTRLAAVAVIADGRLFNLFESARWKRFFELIKPGWKPPSRKTVISLLSPIYSEVHEDVKKRIDGAESISIIFDISDNVFRQRIVNISIQISNGSAFYWKTLDTSDIIYTAENWVQIIYPEMFRLCNNDISRINSVCTDTENTMRFVHDLLTKTPGLERVNFSLYDSHRL